MYSVIPKQGHSSIRTLSIQYKIRTPLAGHFLLRVHTQLHTQRHTVQLLLDEVPDPLLVEAPVLDEGEVPQLGEHLDQGGLPHTSLPLNDHGHPTLRPLVDVEHLDGKVQGEDILGIVDDAQPLVGVQGHVEGTGEVGVQLVTRVQLTGVEGGAR